VRRYGKRHFLDFKTTVWYWRLVKKLKDIMLFPLRTVVFSVGLTAYWMEIAADWLVGIRANSEFVRLGKCKKCGKCCEMIALVLPKKWGPNNRLVKIFSLWHKFAMNFIPEGADEAALYYRCGYLREGAEGRPPQCTLYPFRHRLCRFFPRQGLYGRPSLHDDCGFYFVKRELFEASKKLKKRCGSNFKETLSKVDTETKSEPLSSDSSDAGAGQSKM
jgi:hypothetical protein